jgi:hypothetical protein
MTATPHCDTCHAPETPDNPLVGGRLIGGVLVCQTTSPCLARVRAQVATGERCAECWEPVEVSHAP